MSSIAAGVHTSLAVAASGLAYGWGGGHDEKLGLGLDGDQSVPLQYRTGQLLCAKV